MQKNSEFPIGDLAGGEEEFVDVDEVYWAFVVLPSFRAHVEAAGGNRAQIRFERKKMRPK